MARHQKGAPYVKVERGVYDSQKREDADALDSAEPGWMVWYGLGTRQFYAAAMWPAPKPTVLQAPTIRGLEVEMRCVERAATRRVIRPPRVGDRR